jgi:hypothetical protein
VRPGAQASTSTLPACYSLILHHLLQALELPENHGVRDQLRGLVHQLKQLPRNVAAPMQLPGANSNGNGRGAHQPEGPQALLARCRELAMQVKVRCSSIGQSRR